MDYIANYAASAIINAPAEKIHLTEWLFTLSDEGYNQCSSANIGAGSSYNPEGKRQSLNVEKIADNLLVQHYVETIAAKNHCKVTSLSDSFSPLGATTLQIIWEIKVEPLMAGSCLFTNRVMVLPTQVFTDALTKAGITDISVVKPTMEVNVKQHNHEETPLFAKDIEVKALKGYWDAVWQN